ncbi:MAG: PQQ-binding-like beta-propeller repeat protein [Streptosporangiaceae bacterium]
MRTTRHPERRQLATSGRSPGRPARAGLIALAGAACVAIGVGPALAAGAAPPVATASASRLSAAPADDGSWTVYHGNPAGTGLAASVSAVDTGSRAWTSPALDGDIYGEPLAWSGRIYVATERDTVYALSSASGAVIWSEHVGTPVPSGLLPCGDIQPVVGITGTPVIDPARDEIFAVADELVNGQPAHILVGLSAASGKREMSQDVDPPGASTAALLQRTGLALDGDHVLLGMGGNDGDCATYRGRVIAARVTGGTPTIFTVDAAPGESQGAIWMGGAAPAVDSSGNIWVSAGNGSVHSGSHAYDDSDSVLELSPSLHLLQYFAPGSWAANNAGDLDMSIEPALLPDGQVLLAGKSDIVYLLDGAHLGGIGGQEATLGPVCVSNIDGGFAAVGTTVYLPCLSGIVAVRASGSPAGLRLLWNSGTAGGPPIVAAGLIWSIGQNGVLYGLDPATGEVRQQASVGTPANHFPTPSVGDGLLLAPSARHVVAFTTTASGSAAAAGSASAPPTSPASQAPAASGGGPSPAAIGGIAAAALIVAGGAGWLLWRRRSGVR